MFFVVFSKRIVFDFDEFNLLNGNIGMARKILTERTDKRSYAIWERNREGGNNHGIQNYWHYLVVVGNLAICTG